MECLGLTFENEQARREHFLALLKEKLQDPEFRKTPGFPQGSDEAILRISDPPYYTACPNPWWPDLIESWQSESDSSTLPNESDHTSPFASDVSESKNDPVYNAHPYHTKVPHRAITRYILHYTRPGDIVLDCFCGTGMTGVAADRCGNTDEIRSLGYQINSNGAILAPVPNNAGSSSWQEFSSVGPRKAILVDISPIATHIASNFCKPVPSEAVAQEVDRILSEVERRHGKMYKTKHVIAGEEGVINYIIWSDIFACPQCQGEIVFWEAALDRQNAKVKDSFACPACSSLLQKKGLERVWTTFYDESIREVVRQAKQQPVAINYSIGSKRYEKIPDQDDLELIQSSNEAHVSEWHPTDRMMEGREARRNDQSGLTHEHHFLTKRNLAVLSTLNELLSASEYSGALRFIFTATMQYVNRMCRLHVGNYFNKKGGVVDKPLEGTLYFPSISLEVNVISRFRLRSRIEKSLAASGYHSGIGCCSSSALLAIPSSSIDYIFVDPPFGANISYSELNCLWEGWLNVRTATSEEAIQNSSHGKSLDDYRHLMTKCFAEAFRLLKPGKWMTVEFSNTKASVWNSIQTALKDAGFVVANVSALDKQKGSFKAVTTPTAVKQDLIISAYKPIRSVEVAISEGLSTVGIWDFIREHLSRLPSANDIAASLAEREPRILFDRLVSTCVQRGLSVPLSSGEFQIGLSDRFPERDGMFFLSDQVGAYDRWRTSNSELRQLSFFVNDESSAIQWVRQKLQDRPQSYQELQPQLFKELQAWAKHEQSIELKNILEQNFLHYDGRGLVPSQIHSYLSSNFKDLRNLGKEDPKLIEKAQDRWYVPDPNKQSDLDRVRDRALLKEFEELKESTQRRIKQFRTEAVRAGFKACWQERDYSTIVKVAAKLPEAVLQEDEKLLMYIDNAQTRLGDDA